MRPHKIADLNVELIIVKLRLEERVNNQTIDPTLIERLRIARHVAVLTGAGISAESGIPTFREAQTGLWARFRPEELASPEAWERDPNLVWKWYIWRHGLVTGAEPNAGHRALVELERHIPDFMLITQNVDGLHRRAGSQRVVELHGNLTRVRCSRGDGVVTDWPATETPPPCPDCGSLLRPDVIWFGETLPSDALETAAQAAKNADVLFSIGTSGLVEPAASLPYVTLRFGGCVVEINPDETPLTSSATFSLRGSAGELLPSLVAATWPEE